MSTSSNEALVSGLMSSSLSFGSLPESLAYEEMIGFLSYTSYRLEFSRENYLEYEKSVNGAQRDFYACRNQWLRTRDACLLLLC